MNKDFHHKETTSLCRIKAQVVDFLYCSYYMVFSSYFNIYKGK